MKFSLARSGSDTTKPPGLVIGEALGRRLATTMLEVPCPECGRRMAVTGKDVVEGRFVDCRGCGKPVRLRERTPPSGGEGP